MGFGLLFNLVQFGPLEQIFTDQHTGIRQSAEQCVDRESEAEINVPQLPLS